MARFDKFLEKVTIREPADVRGAAENLRDISHELGEYRVAVCHNIAIREQMNDAEGRCLATDVFGWTDDDQDRWWRTPQLALDSPLPTACRYESEPFWCNEEGFRTIVPNPMLASLDCRDFVKRGLTPAAIVVPTHMPFGQIGAASFIPHDRTKLDLSEDFARNGTVLGLLARLFMVGYVHAMCDSREVPIAPQLTKREVECLHWAAIGKTDTEIGMILERSRATVRFHMKNASDKLDAVNRGQALFKATQLGYIAPR
ncbi:LuxR C-terminal-related transcriptional regulator [Croceicoccus sp. YJ47]|uniref:helix-turn-helix transcriptional regulator n=1 Tax=Croceicoccus sp. YJ47 TaxID=2798724 RepID=UPI001924D346|nr:LuxR C-terminal-related transcriptional regulator [Croceicoccus sp. YJ47]QQN73425.1 helix-turn-helix transcriptional regulator [Croceicoccus sp. YJ47]